MTRTHLGHAIQIARKDKKWTQERLGQEAGNFAEPGSNDLVTPVSVSWLSELERNPYPATYGLLCRIAGALGTTVGQLEASLHVEPLKPEEVSQQRAGPG